MFKEIKNRDAWSTIRGFVYQVDSTIVRWLKLEDNEILELEKGEDIDIITRDLEQNEISRELEQIKYRESSISLNQEITLEILFNFFIHKSSNTSHKLLFRFVTNTGYTTERPALFLNGKKGIEAWIELFELKSIDPFDKRFLNIKKHLLKKIKEKIEGIPKPVSKENKLVQKQYEIFYNHIDDNQSLAVFIKSFDWCVENDDHTEISNVIKATLVDSGIAADSAQAELFYSRLFLFVFKLLCSNSLKKLDKNDLLNQASLSALNLSDQNLLNLLNSLLKSLDNRVAIIEEIVNLNSAQISTLIKDVNLINDSDTVFDYRLSNLSITPPALIRNGSLRKEKVIGINQIFNTRSWVAFQGINGTGKSQLASLVATQYAKFWWLDLRAYNQNIEKTTLLIETFLSVITHTPLASDRKVWIDKVVNLLPPGALIVFNDIPKVEKNSPLSDFLILLANSMASAGVKLLTTSNNKIPSTTIQSLNENLFLEYYDFNFTDPEVIELLNNNGANKSITNYVDLITAITHRNPQLIGAVVQHLKSIDWGEGSTELFDVIFKNEFSAEIVQDAQHSIKKFIIDEKSRELLYRLSLIHWDFTLKEVKSISEVEEKIPHPNDKLHDLLNIWIQEHKDSFHISPLIYDIGNNNLSSNVIQNVHLAFARSVVADKKLDLISASKSINSFIKGYDYNNAGVILLNVYRSAKTSEEIKYLTDWGYLLYWTDIDIPKKMNVLLRTAIRNEQIRMFQFLNKDVTPFINRLKGYVQEDSLTISEQISIHAICLSNFKDFDLKDFWSRFDFVLKHWKEIDSAIRETYNLGLFSELLWIPIHYMESKIDIEKWFKCIDIVVNESKVDFFNNDIAQTAITLLSSKIVNSKSGIEEGDKKWLEIINRLEILVSFFKKNKLEILEAIVLKEINALQFQKLNNQKTAEKIIISNAKRFSNIEAKYLLYENIGKLYYNDKNTKKSIEWLFKALDLDCKSQINFIDTLIYGACAISKTDSIKAVALFEKAVEIGKQREEYPEIDYIQILAELGVAYWINKEFEKCFQAFEEVVERFFNSKGKEATEVWIRLFKLTGHTLSYIASTFKDGTIPQTDGRDFFEPYQGVFSFNTKDLSDLYQAKNDPIILSLLAIFADGLNNMKSAYDWSLRAFDLARKNGDKQMLLMISSMCNQYSLVNFKIEEAFESYLTFASVSTHLKEEPKEKHKILGEINLEDILSAKPSEEWDNAEDTTVLVAIIPIFIMVLSAQLQNNENKKERYESYIYLLQNYIPNSSDTLLWELILELSIKIIDKQISERELIDRGNTFGGQGRKNLQIICDLGIIYLTRDNEKLLKQIINIFPYLTKIHKSSSSIIKFVYVPFVKNRSLKILTDSFMGSTEELQSIQNDIENVDISGKNPIQKILQPIVKELNISLVKDRKSWLYDYEEI